MILIDVRGHEARDLHQLAVLPLPSRPVGPYDEEVDNLDGLLRYAHRMATPEAGQCIERFRATDLGVPLIAQEVYGRRLHWPNRRSEVPDGDALAGRDEASRAV